MSSYIFVETERSLNKGGNVNIMIEEVDLSLLSRGN